MKKHTILVVDDDRTNLQIVKDVLSKEYELQLAISGEMALKFAARRKPDLILMDLMMPGMDGRETMRLIRAMPENRDIPYVFLTANQDPETEADCLNMGASDFITKPIVSIAARMCPPMEVCSLISPYSSVVSLPSFLRIRSGMPILPTSCSRPVW